MMIDRNVRLRKYRHLLLTKIGELTPGEQYWLEYLNSILGNSSAESEFPDAAE